MAVRRTLTFDKPRSVRIDPSDVPSPDAGEVLVKTIVSAVSPGTEGLVYRGETPDAMAADANIEGLGEALSFPISYGYCTVGTVLSCGEDVSADWEGQRVFSFQPHTSHFTASPDALIPIPDAADATDAALLPNVETAVTLVMDGRPMVGERVAVFGQGVVGLLTTALLARHPVDALVTVDPVASRRDRSVDFGATASFAPDDPALSDALQVTAADAVDAQQDDYEGADLTFECTGQPHVLNDALAVTGFDGRVVVGSWYGSKRAPIDLGGRFHRSRIRIHSSQVSTVAADLRGRWTKDRRMKTVLDHLTILKPSRLVDGRFSLDDAPDVYRRLDEGDLLQPVFDYD